MVGLRLVVEMLGLPLLEHVKAQGRTADLQAAQQETAAASKTSAGRQVESMTYFGGKWGACRVRWRTGMATAKSARILVVWFR